MADSYSRVVASGGTSVFSVPFPYLDKSHVFVSLDGVLLETPISWISAAQFNLGFQLSPSTIVLIYRKTPATPIVTFTPGNLDTTDLNVATRQSIFLAQEAVDQAEDNLSLLGGGNAYDAQGRVIRNVGEGALDNDAATLGQVRQLVAVGEGGGSGGEGGSGSPDTPEQILAKLLTVDGPGSGLQADLLDGQDGAFYLDAANLTGTVNPDRLPRANGTTKGASTLSDSTSSTSDVTGGLAATPKAVKTAYDLAASKQAPATTLAGYGITDADTRAQAAAAIQNLRGAQGGLAPLDENGLLPANIFPEGTGGGGGELGYTPEDVAKKNAPNGYAGIDGQSRINPAAVGFFPSPGVFVPLAARLGQEVTLTDGYVEGSNLTDFSDLIDTNLARAVAQGRPFIIPQGKFGATRQFVGANAPVSIIGYGKTQSVIEWLAGSVSSGLKFTFNDDTDYGLFEDFGLYTELFNQGTALEADFNGKIIPNGGNPVVFSRFQPCGHAKGLLIRGTDGTLNNGFQRGIVAKAPLAFHVQDCDLWGASTGPDPNYASEEAIYLGAPDGYGHPVECLIQNNRTFRWKTALKTEGMEGVFAQNNNFVGVGTGIYFKDNLGRPQLNAKNNHINAAQVGIRIENCCQFNVEGNLIYLVIGANQTGTGVLVQGSNTRWGGIVNNDFENTDTANAGSKFNSIIADSDVMSAAVPI